MSLIDTNVLSEARGGGIEPRDWPRSVNAHQVFAGSPGIIKAATISPV